MEHALDAPSFLKRPPAVLKEDQYKDVYYDIAVGLRKPDGLALKTHAIKET